LTAAASGQANIRQFYQIHVAVAVVEAQVDVGPWTQLNSGVTRNTIRARVNKAQVADLLARDLIAAVVATVAAVLLHTPHRAARSEVVRSAFNSSSE
jgi:hypothetical protein